MSDVAIRATDLGKRYRIGAPAARYRTLREALAAAALAPLRTVRDRQRRRTSEEFWALRGVSFEVRRGEVLGIVGHNGAGKSTLLKLLARVTRPTTGRATIAGRVGSLLEVGTGFHGELTGRENIYLNGAILGMKRAEIRQKFDRIVEFAEVERFLDTPVKRYSSGMHMRLAFSVAAHLEPEILLVDEVLAVGDAAFQQRCLGKMRGIAESSGRTVLFVSHNLQAVRTLCDRGLFLSQGRAVFDGTAPDAVKRYLEFVRQGARMPLGDHPDRGGDGAIRLTGVCTRDEHGAACSDFVAGEPLTFDFTYQRRGRRKSVHLGLTIYNELGMACTHLNTSSFDLDLDGSAERGRVACRVGRNPLPVGEYVASVVLTTDEGVADLVPGCLSFRVIASHFFPTLRAPDRDLSYCPVMVDHTWRHTPG